MRSNAGNDCDISPRIMQKYINVCPSAAPQKEAKLKSSVESEKANFHPYLGVKGQEDKYLQPEYDAHHYYTSDASKKIHSSVERMVLSHQSSGKISCLRVKSLIVPQIMNQYQLT